MYKRVGFEFNWCGGEMRFDNNDKWNGIELGVYIHFVYCNNANMGKGDWFNLADSKMGGRE